MKLKQITFCEEYLIDFNAAQAAIRAGYSKKTARTIGSKLLTKIDIQQKIKQLQEELSKKLGVSIQMVVAEYSNIAFNDIRKFYGVDGQLLPIKDLDDRSAAALASVESWEEKMDSVDDEEKIVVGTNRKIKTYDKVRALDSLCRVLGFNAPEKREIGGPGGKPIQVKQTSDIDYTKLSESALMEILNARNASKD